jgi:predicted regulator of Ras-like GTPase activity (Roadblock/LC7/MglB family)
MENIMADHIEDSNFINFRSGFSLTVNQISYIERDLRRLFEMIPAKYILLVDTSGQFVTSVGENSKIDSAVMGSLIAADLAASQEIALLTEEYQDYQMVLREGKRTNIIISEAGKHLILLVLFSRETPLGWARKLIQKSSSSISEITLTPQQETNTINTLEENKSGGDLPELFNNALDQIWKD